MGISGYSYKNKEINKVWYYYGRKVQLSSALLFLWLQEDERADDVLQGVIVFLLPLANKM